MQVNRVHGKCNSTIYSAFFQLSMRFFIIAVSTVCSPVYDERYRENYTHECLRPYYDENTRSRPITEVKHHRAGIVLGWGTAWELPVA